MANGLPSYEQLPQVDGARTSWGLWNDPRLGCLELITAEHARKAVSLVHTGSVFRLDAALDEFQPPLFGREPLIHDPSGRGGAAMDDHITQWNTQASTQWDGFLHIRDMRRGFFGGLDESQHGIHHWARRGIVGRAVLADVARWRESRGRPLAFNERDEITHDDLLATLDHQNTRVEIGDILLIRTGWVGRYRQLAPEHRAAVTADGGLPGMHGAEETAAALWNLHVAAVAADNPSFEAWPPDFERRQFLHLFLLPRLGIPIGELWDLDALAEDCAGDGRYECMLVSSPLALTGGVASPPNAVAIR